MRHEGEMKMWHCDGCYRRYPISQLKRCKGCGKLYCPSCRATHTCLHPRNQTPKNTNLLKIMIILGIITLIVCGMVVILINGIP